MLLLDRTLAEWIQPEPPLAVPVAVNLSPRHLRDLDLADRVADALALRGVPPALLVLEITENFLMSDIARSTRCLTRLHDMGVGLAIDDFGTGYSSLSYLRQLPLDELKIDRSFVKGVADGDDAIVRSTIDLAHSIGLTVVAEGVESEAVRDRLRELGCDAAQGIFLAAPGPSADIRRWIARQQSARQRAPLS